MTFETDTEYEETTITKVEPSSEGWAIERADGWSFYVPPAGVEPHVGDTARFYGRGIGSTVRGLIINGKTVFYRTPEEEEAKYQEWRRQYQRDKEERFKENQEKLDLAYAGLPKPFQFRIDGFRKRNPTFRVDNEAYELSSCVDAVSIADYCKAEGLGVETFKALSWDEQKKAIPTLFDGHSGNSFGMALRLAWLYLSDPELVIMEHGALCPLVGCAEYGCPQSA